MDNELDECIHGRSKLWDAAEVVLLGLQRIRLESGIDTASLEEELLNGLREAATNFDKTPLYKLYCERGSVD